MKDAHARQVLISTLAMASLFMGADGMIDPPAVRRRSKEYYIHIPKSQRKGKTPNQIFAHRAGLAQE